MFRRTREYSPNDGVALITGGASGIGRALGEELARRGFEVWLADRQDDLVEEVAETIRRAGGLAVATAMDVTDFAAWEALRDEMMGRSKRIGILFNNAGIVVGGEMLDYDVRDWDDVLDVNLRGVVYGMNREYNVADVIPDYEVLKGWAEEKGLDPDPASLAKNDQVQALIEEEVNKLSTEFKGFEKVRKIFVGDEDFTTENGMLTPTMKLKRRIVQERYGDAIESLYA